MRRSLLFVLLLSACTGSIQDGTPLEDGAVSDEDAGASNGGAKDGAVGPGARNDAGGDAATGGGRDAANDAATGNPSPVDSGNNNGNGPSDAGRDAATVPVDASTPPVDSGVVVDSGGPPASGTVPVFVAAGYGTRLSISCDLGLTWKNDVADVQNGGDDGTLIRGLAAGNGKFVAARGGGGTQILMWSDNGVDWTRVMRNGNGYSDVSFGNGRFVAGGGHISVVSTDGANWGQDGTMGTGGILRHLTFGNYMGGRFVAVGDQGRRMNSSDGVTWGSEISGGDTLIGVDFGNNVFVAITGGATTAYSENGGSTWQAGSISGASEVRGILFDGARFIVTTRTATFTSTDGKAWTSNTATGGPGSFAKSDDGGHYAGAMNDVLYHSTDGIHFTVVKQGGQAFTRVKFQRVKPSTVCPL